MWLLIVSIVVFLFMFGIYGAASRRAAGWARKYEVSHNAFKLRGDTLKRERATAGAQLLSMTDAYKLAEERRLGAGRALLKTINEKRVTERQLSDFRGNVAGITEERNTFFDGQENTRTLVAKIDTLLREAYTQHGDVQQKQLCSLIALIDFERKNW